MDKDRLRNYHRHRRQSWSDQYRDDASRQICQWLNCCAPGGPVMAYMAIHREVDLDLFLQSRFRTGSAVFLPRVRGKRLEVAPVYDPAVDLQPGAFSILEPVTPAVDPRTIQWILVPGIAFGPAGERLGYGGGFYDRFLATCRQHHSPCVLGVAFSKQISLGIVSQSHDQTVDRVLTENAWLICDQCEDELDFERAGNDG